MKKKNGENHLRKEEKESSKKGMNKKKEYINISFKIKVEKEIYEYLKNLGFYYEKNIECYIKDIYKTCKYYENLKK